MRPAICEGSGPTTRFSVTALGDGWLKVTLCWLPTLKLCQLTAARWVDWLIAVLLAVWLIAAAPAITTPPVGWAFGAGWAWAGSASTRDTVACNAVLIISAGRPRRMTPRSLTFLSRRAFAIKYSAVAA